MNTINAQNDIHRYACAKGSFFNYLCKLYARSMAMSSSVGDRLDAGKKPSFSQWACSLFSTPTEQSAPPESLTMRWQKWCPHGLSYLIPPTANPTGIMGSYT